MDTPRNTTEQPSTQRVGVRPSLAQGGACNSTKARITAALLAAISGVGLSGCPFLDNGGNSRGAPTEEENPAGSCDGTNERIAPKVVPIEDSCRIDGGVANISFEVPELDECRAPLTVTLMAAIQTQDNNGQLSTRLVPLDAPVTAYEPGRFNMSTSIGTGAILYLILEVTDDTGAKFRTAPFCSASAV